MNSEVERPARYDSIYVSPHLDDVPLSCALRLLTEQKAGKKNLVVTIFSSGLTVFPGVDLYFNRRSEDRKALSLLGISDPLWLGFHDAPYRTPHYWSFETIVMSDHKSDEGTEEKIAARLLELCEKFKPKRIYLPLAIGTHKDHRLTHQMWCHLSTKAELIFYEDRPYVFLPESQKLRLKQIGAQASTGDSKLSHRDALKEFASGLGRISLYKDVIKSKRVRFLYTLWAARLIHKKDVEPRLNIEPEIISTDDASQVALISSAIAAYTSQMKMLFDKSSAAFEKESIEYAKTLNHAALYAERYWKLMA